jgi:hypothetical protein
MVCTSLRSRVCLAVAASVALVGRCSLAVETGGPAAGAATATDQAADQTLDGALEVQRALGGPAVDQFQQLQAPPDPQPEPTRPTTPWYRQFRGTLGAEASDEVLRQRRVPPPERGWQAAWPTGEPLLYQAPMAPPVVVQAVAQDPERGPRSQIAALRGTAAQLETTANRLEEIELYEQADALRELAQRLRRDARGQLARARGESEAPRYGDPGEAPRDEAPRALPSDPPRQGRRATVPSPSSDGPRW